MSKKFEDFTYGVGLDINASSFKQVKDSLKLNLDSLSKMVKSYGKVLKIDPNADLSKLFNEMQKIKSIVDGIDGSNNSFAGFVDKGVLGRIASLESELLTIKSTSKEAETNLSGLTASIASMTESLKAAGAVKFPATFDNLFGNLEDKTAKIKNVQNTIGTIEASLTKLQNLWENLGSPKASKNWNEDQVFDWIARIDDIKMALGDTSKLNATQLNSFVQELESIGMKLGSAIASMSADKLESFQLNDEYVIAEIDECIKSVKAKKQELQLELESLNKAQENFKNKQSAQVSSGKKLGVVDSAQIDITPRVSKTEWKGKIDTFIKDLGAFEVQVIPTVFKTSKNTTKELNSQLSKITHQITANLQVVDNLDNFEAKVNSINNAIRNAKSQIEQNAKFKIGFTFDESQDFKKAAYDMINKFKKIDAKFYIANGKKFLADIIRLREKAKKELNIPATFTIDKQEELLSSVDSLVSDIKKKVSNIGVNLTLQNAPQVSAQAALMQDDLKNAGMGAAGSGTNDATQSVVELSEKGKAAQAVIENIKNSLRSLTNLGFNSPEFLKIGDFDQAGKYIDGTREKLKQMIDELLVLSQKMQITNPTDLLKAYPEANSNIEIAAQLALQDTERMEQLEAELNQHLQKQLAYLNQQHEAAQKILDTEIRITTEKNKQPSTQTQDTSEVKVNENLAISAEEAAKKIRSLNATLSHQKKWLNELENSRGWKDSSRFIQLGEWDDKTGSFKKNSNYIEGLIQKYKELRSARLKAGGAGQKVSGEEASIRNKLSGIFASQKKHLSEIISKNQEELESVRQISAAYKQAGENKSKATKQNEGTSSSINQLDELTSKLNKAKSTLQLLQSSKFDAIGKTGLGDVNKRLEAAGSQQGFKELINVYNQLIAKKQELENTGKTGTNEYVQLVNAYKIVEQHISTIYQDQLKYTQSKIGNYETEIAKAKELLEIEREQTREDEKQSSASAQNVQTTLTSSAMSVKLDGATLGSLAKDTTLRSIDGKVNSILSQIGKGVLINGSNISIEASNVSVSGKGATTGTSKNSGEKEVKLSTISSYSQQLVALEERIKRSGLYTDDLKQKFIDLNTQLNNIRVQDDADLYKIDLNSFKEEFEQLKTYDKLYQNFIKSQSEQLQLKNRITTSTGSTSELKEQLKVEKENSRIIEEQLLNYTTLYDTRARQLALEEAIKQANQEIAKSNAAQNDKNVNNQNSALVKIVDSAQTKFNDMQYGVNNFKTPMSDAAISKFKEYERLLISLKEKQQEIASNPDLLKNQDYSTGFNDLLLKMQGVHNQFTTLQKSSEDFLSKIKSADDIKPLASTFDVTNVTQLHNAMHEFANQVGVGAAKLIEFNDVERTAIFEIQNGKGQVQQLTVAYDEGTNSLGRYTSKTKESISETQKFFNSLKHSFQNVARYVASFGSVYRLFAIFKQGVTYVREIDSALTELKKVTNETDETYNKFLQTMSQTASITGSTVKDLTTSAADWARLGYSIEEAGELAKNTSILMNVSEFDNVNNATDTLISALQAFKKEGQNVGEFSMQIIDKYNEVGNNYAISTSDLAESLTRSSAALVAANNSLEQSIALTTAANTTIQDPESVGNALKVVSMRIRGVKTELEEAGEDTEGMVTNTAKLQEKIMALTNIDGEGGINILTDSGEFKSTYDILLSISKIWKELSDTDQAALLELVAGKTRGSVVAALFQNGDVLENAFNSASNAVGSAESELNTYLDSIQGRIEIFTNEVQTFWMNTIESDMVKNVVDLGTHIVDLVDKIGLLPTALGGVLLYFTAIKKNNPATMFKDLYSNIQNYTQAIKALQTIKSVAGSVGNMSIEQFNAGPVNAYAAAVSNLSAKQQAATLSAFGLNTEHIRSAMRVNEVTDENIRLALSEANVSQAKTTNTTLTGLQVASMMKQQGATISQNAANFLLENSTNEVTKAMLAKAVVQGKMSHQDAATILQSGILSGALKAQAFSWKALGTAIKTTFSSNPVGWIMMIVSALNIIISKVKQAKEETIQAAEQSINAYKESQKTVQEQKKTIDEISASYERLSKGVDLNTNENINLTTKSYQEYLNICNDIADMYPHLVTGFDAQGNAILSLKGNVDELVQAYKEAAQASRQKMIAGGDDIFNTFKNNVFDSKKTAWDQAGLTQQVDVAEQLLKAINSGNKEKMQSTYDSLFENRTDALYKVLESSGLQLGDFRNGLTGKIDVESYKQTAQKLQSFVKSTTTQINTETSKVKSLMDAYLGEDLDYAALSDKNRSFIDQIVSGFSADFISGFDSADTLYNWIKTNIIGAFQDSSVIDAINSLSDLQVEFAKGDMSYSDYKEQLNEYISQIQNKVDKDALAQIKIGIGIDESSLQTAVNHALNLLGGDDRSGFRLSKVASLSVEDLQIAGQLEIPEGTTLSWEELTTKIKEAKIAATEDFDITNFTDTISAHSAAISEYQEALQKLDKGSFTMDDFMELIKKYPELAKGVDISSNAFHGLSRNLNGAIKTSTKNFIKQLKELRVSLVAAGKSTDSIDQLIEAIENMPEDAVDGTIQKYSTLADKIDNARRAQDKLSASMGENPNEGYETRGEAMEYMKEAMKKGEIGSESNLWNVAEKYGFTYDSAKTINENADALAEFIALRERWFKEDDDGDDGTDDGYSYKGTENFIKDVESAVKDSAELQKYLTWDYDESAGTLNFDYNNEDWDTIVSILSKTKELAGLTSDEFSDMMIQIGQYFGIDWGNYDDVLSHLNKITTGTSDAKTKVEEYGKAMQDHFGDNSDVDLTTRPMVKFDSTNFKEWEKLYQEIINNPDGHSEADVKNAQEQLSSIQRGDSYATVYSSTFSNDDGTKSVVVTPILPDGTVLSPKQLEEYANKLLAGEELEPGVDIKLAKFDGSNSIEKAGEYAQALHEAQAEYDTLRDTLGISTTIDDKGIEGLAEIKEIQNAIHSKADGTVVIDEDAFKEALTGAQYTEDQIDVIIDKIKNLNKEAFNIDPFKLDEVLDKDTGKGLQALEEIEKVRDSLTKDDKTGITIFDTDMFTSVLREAGYTEDKIKSLIDRVKEFQGITAVSGNTDPLGLNNAGLSADSLKASLSALGVTYEDTLGTWFDGKRDLTINVTDLVTTLKAKGWTDASIKEYITNLSNNTNLEGFNVKVKGIENIDEVIKTASEVPEEETTEYTVTGTGLSTVQTINDELNKIPATKSTNYTITETTVKKTKDKTKFNLFDPSTWANGTANAQGTAFAGGSWGAPRTETALTGELGPEILVRNGRWTTVGENGAEFTQVKKGDIIFNHKQSEQLLKNGYVTGRGKAYASGTAYAEGSGTFARYGFSESGGWQQYDVNDTVVESWGDLSGAIDKATDSLKSASDEADKFEETFDWIEVRLEEINEQLDLMDAQLENAGDYASKNSIIERIMGVNTNKMANLMAGIQKYSDYAARLLSNVPSQYREAAKDGAIAITEFVGEADEKTVEAIEKYREWAQKVADLKQELEGVKTELRELAIQKLDNAYESGSVRATIEGAQTEKLQNAVDYDEEKGLIARPEYYAAMAENSGKTVEYLTKARNEMQKEFDKMLAEGLFNNKDGSYNDFFYQELEKMYGIDAEIDKAVIELETFQNAINDIYWDNFDALIDKLDYISEQSQSLIDLMDSADMVTTPDNINGWSEDDVKWTKEGLASLGLHAQQLERAEEQAKLYAKAIDVLNEEYKEGHYSESEYQEKLNELIKSQYDAIEAAEDEKEAIVDLQQARIDDVKKGIEKQLKAYEELIDKKKKALDTEKDLYDFQKDTTQQQKNIANIERQLAALANDNSMSAIAQRKQLEAELAEAQYNLQDTYYNRSVENKQNALDQELEAFQIEREAEIAALDEYLTNVEQVVTDSLAIVQENADIIGQTLTDKTKEYNLTVSDAILSPWNSGKTAIDEYTTKFGDTTSATVSQLDGIRSKWVEIKSQMDAANASMDTYLKNTEKYHSLATPTVKDINTENNNYYQNKNTPKPTTTTTTTTKPTTTTTPAKPSLTTGSYVEVKSGTKWYADSYGGGAWGWAKSGKIKYINTSGSYAYNIDGLGWIKKTDIKGYAKGTNYLKKSGLVNIDELGEELVIGAKNGRLTYLEKGSGVIPADITSNLMAWGALNPQDMLDRNRPSITPNKSVINNNVEINMNIAEVVHVDRVDHDTLPDLTKAVKKQMDSYMAQVNNAIKAKVR